MKLILGSKSPRRHEILSYYGIPFDTMASPFQEEEHPLSSPETYVLALAEGKGKSLLKDFPDRPILSADTIVVLNDRIYGKPKDEKEAYEMLSSLSGETHRVLTGVALCDEGQVYSAVEETKVTFHRLTEAQIKQYLASIPYLDKAGSYAIQGSGGIICQGIEGCYYNVMGLPINTVAELLKKSDINLWQHLVPSS